MAVRSHVEDYGEVKLDADGNIRLELPCAGCGYDLRGLPVTGNCPECGCAISTSTRVPRHTLRRWLLPLAPMVAINLICVMGTLYCQQHTNYYSSSFSWYQRTHYKLARILEQCLPIGSFVIILLCIAILLLRRRDLPMVVNLLLNILIVLSLAMT